MSEVKGIQKILFCLWVFAAAFTISSIRRDHKASIARSERIEELNPNNDSYKDFIKRWLE
jgi:hypothetical protein